MKLKSTFLIITAIILAVAVSRQISHPVKKLTRRGNFFGSYVKVDVCYQDGQLDTLTSALDEVWARFGDIHARLSVYDPSSDINKINQAYDVPVTVPEDTYQRVTNAVKYYDISEGVFDITVGPLIKLWKQKGKQHVMPSPEEILEAKALVDIKAVDLMENHQIRLARKGVKINIDSTGDGYAADEAARILRGRGFADFLVDASGELYAAGNSCQGKKWRVGIRDPNDEERVIDIVEVSNMAVSTSGSYERFYEIDGKRWSHIIDPRSGYPAKKILSATVIAPSTELADFLSTAFCVLPAQESLRIINGFGAGHEAMMIEDTKEQKKVSSREYERFSVFKEPENAAGM